MPGELALPRWINRSTGPAAVSTDTDVHTLVAAHAAVLFRVAYAVLRQRDQAEDCVQEAFLRLVEQPSLLAGLREPRPWLIRVTWNAAIDRRRRHRPEQADSLFLDSLISPGTPADRQHELRLQLAATLAEIDRLPRVERELLLLSAFEELTPTDIAAALGKTPSATRALLHRARTRLRERLERKGLA